MFLKFVGVDSKSLFYILAIVYHPHFPMASCLQMQVIAVFVIWVKIDDLAPLTVNYGSADENIGY